MILAIHYDYVFICIELFTIDYQRYDSDFIKTIVQLNLDLDHLQRSQHLKEYNHPDRIKK
jgi:hypothetical protein